MTSAAPRPVCLTQCHCRVVYMLQSSPVEDVVRLLSPILSAEDWVGDHLDTSTPDLAWRRKNRMTIWGFFCKWFLSAAFQLYRTPSDLLPSHQGASVSRPSGWCWHPGGTVANPSRQDSVRPLCLLPTKLYWCMCLCVPFLFYFLVYIYYFHLYYYYYWQQNFCQPKTTQLWSKSTHYFSQTTKHPSVPLRLTI